MFIIINVNRIEVGIYKCIVINGIGDSVFVVMYVNVFCKYLIDFLRNLNDINIEIEINLIYINLIIC